MRKNSELEQMAERLFCDEDWPQGRIGIDLAKGRIWEVVNGNENDITTVARQIAVFNEKADIQSDDNIKLMGKIIDVVIKDPNSHNFSPSQLTEFILDTMKVAQPGVRKEDMAGFKFMFRALLTPSIVQRALETAARNSECLDTLKALLALNRKKLRAA